MHLQSSPESKMHEQLLASAPSYAIRGIIDDEFGKGFANAVAWLNDIVRFTLSYDQKRAITDVLEDYAIQGSQTNLTPYLAILFDSIKEEALAQYYLLQWEESCNEQDNACLDDIRHQLKQKYYRLPAELTVSPAMAAYNLDSRVYTYMGIQKEYSVRSFSQEIGKNMTLLKTPYGAVIFDCGAECGSDVATAISEVELLTFLKENDVSPNDICAVFISHAHLDHYGSLTFLMNIGIKANKIFANATTKELMNAASKDIPFIDSLQPIESFFYPDNLIKVRSFANGHILGSVGLVVSFDNINVVYTGDFCMHDQRTIHGLDTCSILDIEEVKQTGIDCLITETTYGNRENLLKYEDSVQIFQHLVDKALKAGYKVFIPSFAIGRSQEVTLALHEKHQVLIDGLAIKLCKIYEDSSPLTLFNSNTRYGLPTDDKAHNFDCNDIVIASSGMLSHGSTSARYLQDLLGDNRKVAVFKTGYISSEAYGTVLLRRWKSKSNSFFDISLSAHADRSEILDLINVLCPRVLVTIHGKGLGNLSPTVKKEEHADDIHQAESILIPVQQQGCEPAIQPEATSSPKNPVAPSALGKTGTGVKSGAFYEPQVLTAVERFMQEFSRGQAFDNVVVSHSAAFIAFFQELRIYPENDMLLAKLRETFASGNSLVDIVYQIFEAGELSKQKSSDSAPEEATKASIKHLDTAKQLVLLAEKVYAQDESKLLRSKLFSDTLLAFLAEIKGKDDNLYNRIVALGEDYIAVVKLIAQLRDAGEGGYYAL